MQIKLCIPKRKTLHENFKQGDVLFGLLDPRYEVGKQLSDKGYTHVYANDLNSPAVKLAVNRTTNKKAKPQLDSNQFAHFRLLRRNLKYLKRQPGRPVPLMKDDPKLGASYRRACKLLLINRSVKRTYKTHVITKGIDWRRVCTKRKSDLGVTNSEMRAAFRDAVRHGKNRHILFYDQDLKLMNKPPWEQEENKELFEGYRKTFTV